MTRMMPAAPTRAAQTRAAPTCAVLGLVALAACVPAPPPPASPEDQAACRTDVMFETNNPTVTIVSSEATALGSIVQLSVGEQGAPWRCVVDLDGNTSIQSQSNEGFL